MSLKMPKSTKIAPLSTGPLDTLYTYMLAVFGNLKSQHKIGMHLSRVENLEAQESGVVWLSRASLKGHPSSCLELALHYINNCSDTDKAIEILRLANTDTTDTNLTGQIHALLGQLLLGKYTDVIDHRKFEKQTQIKKKGQDALDEYIQSLMPKKAKPKKVISLNISEKQLSAYLDEALSNLYRAQKLKHPMANHALAVYLIQYSKREKANTSKGLDLLHSSANEGFAPSCQVLAGIYENGLYGVTQNIRRGLELRVTAAKKGSKEAQYTLGYLLYNGQGFEENKDMGLELIKESASKGNNEAAVFLDTIKHTP